MGAVGLQGDCDVAGRRWFVVQTQPHRELTARSHLQRQSFRVFLPLFRKTVRHARRFHTREAPLFPGYLFIALTPGFDRWRSINGTIGVSHLITAGDQPMPVRPGIVEGLLAVARSNGLIEAEPTLKPGDRVRITSGPLAGSIGHLLTLDDAQRVSVLLDALGVKVRFSGQQVGLVPA